MIPPTFSGWYVQFPFLDPEKRLDARVTHFFPKRRDNTDDITLLEILDNLPADAKAVQFATAETYSGHKFGVYGFPVGFEDNGQYVEGKLQEKLVNKRIQAVGTSKLGYFIERGFSGSPVYDKKLSSVVGIVAQIDGDIKTRIAHVIPVSYALNRLSLTITVNAHKTIFDNPSEAEKKQLVTEWLSVALTGTVVVDHTATVEEVNARLTQTRAKVAVVIKHGKPVGILTITEIQNSLHLVQSSDFKNFKIYAEQIAIQNVAIVTDDTKMEEVARRLKGAFADTILVVDNNGDYLGYVNSKTLSSWENRS